MLPREKLAFRPECLWHLAWAVVGGLVLAVLLSAMLGCAMAPSPRGVALGSASMASAPPPRGVALDSAASAPTPRGIALDFADRLRDLRGWPLAVRCQTVRDAQRRCLAAGFPADCAWDGWNDADRDDWTVKACKQRVALGLEAAP